MKRVPNNRLTVFVALPKLCFKRGGVNYYLAIVRLVVFAVKAKRGELVKNHIATVKNCRCFYKNNIR